MDLGLQGKVVVITGGSDGLGAALARSLVAEGAHVALCARRADRLERVVADLVERGGEAIGVPADVTDPEALTAVVDAALARWGRIDGVVNNAGVSATGSIAEMDDAAWSADLDLKLLGAVRLIRVALPHLRATGGSVVNVLSIAAKAPPAGSAPSSVSRAAGLALAKALSKEEGPRGVRVNAVLVGLVESGQWERQAAEEGRPLQDLYRDMAEASPIPLGRVGRAEEFADVVAFLLSERASYLSGIGVNIDGGLAAVV